MQHPEDAPIGAHDVAEADSLGAMVSDVMALASRQRNPVARDAALKCAQALQISSDAHASKSLVPADADEHTARQWEQQARAACRMAERDANRYARRAKSVIVKLSRNAQHRPMIRRASCGSGQPGRSTDYCLEGSPRRVQRRRPWR